jgi:hypothetical protein
MAGRGLRLQARTTGAENRHGDLSTIDIHSSCDRAPASRSDPGDRARDADSETPSRDQVRRRPALPAAGPGRAGSLVQLSPSH